MSQRNVTTELYVTLVRGTSEQAAKLCRQLEIISIGRRSLHSEALDVSRNLTKRLCAPGFCNDLHDSAAGMSILRLKARRFHLHFLDERKIDSGAKRAIGTGPNTHPAECRVVDRNTIRHIGILKPARS